MDVKLEINSSLPWLSRIDLTFPEPRVSNIDTSMPKPRSLRKFVFHVCEPSQQCRESFADGASLTDSQFNSDYLQRKLQSYVSTGRDSASYVA